MRTPECKILVYRFENQSLVNLLDDVRDWLLDNGAEIVYDITIHTDTGDGPPSPVAFVYVVAP